VKFDEYQKKAITTDLYGGQPQTTLTTGFINKVLGLCGEAGEVAEKIKKIQRSQDGKITKENRQELMKELGDVLWYLSALARYLDISLDEVAQANLDKLFDRKARGVIKGEGDNR